MARSQKVVGVCHICGVEGPLSFEHVPPRKAFNDRPVLLATFDKIMETGPVPGGVDIQSIDADIQQRGAGAYTLCPRCNNNTGSWYGSYFVNWSHQGMHLLDRAGGAPSLIYMRYVFPLPVLKQIATMFFSVNSPVFGAKHPDLVRFVLNRETKYLPARYRIFTYFTGPGQYRHVGVVGSGNFRTGDLRILSEVAFPPFGYLLALDATAPDLRLFEITDFKRYDYGEFAVLNLKLPVLPTHLPLPGDYRSLDEIERDMRHGDSPAG